MEMVQNMITYQEDNKRGANATYPRSHGAHTHSNIPTDREKENHNINILH